MFNSSKNKKISFQQFLENVSFIADDYMINIGARNKINYVGGDCVITHIKKSICVLITLYGKNKDNTWNKSNLKLTRKMAHFTNDNKTISALNKLIDEPLKFKVEPPKER